MSFTPRLKQILIVMLKQDTPMSLKAVAEEVGISKRTTQRELEYVVSSLKNYEVQFQSKTGIGVWLEGSTEAKEELLHELLEDDTADVSDKDSRRKRLILELLKDKNPKKLFYYADLLGVSEATVSHDLDAIADWLATFDLSVSRKQGYGIALSGTEKDVRSAMRSFINDNLNTDMIRDIYMNPQRLTAEMVTDKNGSCDILNDAILKRVVNCILAMQDKRLKTLTENSFVGLTVHITIAIERILKGEIIENNEELQKKLQADDSYELAEFIVETLEEEFELTVPDVEIAYICLHIMASKKRFHEGKETSFLKNYGKKEMMRFVNEMIEAYDENLAYTLKQDEEFVSGFLAHLQPTLIRLKNHMGIRNPLLKQIKENYSEIYQKCEKVAAVLEEHLQIPVPEEEIGFMAIHFGAAVARIEEQQMYRRKVQIGIVCASGIGIARLMYTKVSTFLKDRAQIHTYGSEEVTPYIISKMDFLISGIPFEFEGADILNVSPLLIGEDMNEIEKRVQMYERMPKQQAEDDFSKSLEQVNVMAALVKTVINDMHLIKVEKEITFDGILDKIVRQMTPYYEKQEILRDDLVSREHLFTQVIPEYGFALLHTMTKGVEKPNFSVYIPEDGEIFEDGYFQKIHSVITMLIPDDERAVINRELMGYLTTCLLDENSLLKTIETGIEEEIRGHVSRLLKRYFKQYLEKV